MPNIIFHIPFKINPKLSSGTNLRPMKMRQAFLDLGYQVDFIMGTGKERKVQIKTIKAKIEAGTKYDFVYAENSTLPTLLTESHHLPTYPFLDFGFLKFCKQNKIPIGLFYRDIFWNFEAYSLKGIKAFYTRTMYRYDLKKYQQLVDVFFIPSLEMLPYIPCTIPATVTALPPGHNSPVLAPKDKTNSLLKLFYVGGLSSHYQMEELFEAVSNVTGVQLTVCTRKEEWEKAKTSTYKKYCDVKNIKVVHRLSHELMPYYQEADIAMLFVKPFEYWKFATPIKLFEYIGNKKPIIASENSIAGTLVQEQNIGWTIPYEHKALSNLLTQLVKDKSVLEAKQKNIDKVYTDNTWQARAKKVVQLLSKKAL